MVRMAAFSLAISLFRVTMSSSTEWSADAGAAPFSERTSRIWAMSTAPWISPC